MSESELEYRLGALELEHRLHNIGQFEQFKAFRVIRTDGQPDGWAQWCVSAPQFRARIDKSSRTWLRDGATIIRNCAGKTVGRPGTD